MVLGHEITGEVIEVGQGVEFIKKGDVCSVPLNIAQRRCDNRRRGHTGICLNVNPARPGAAYGYVDMGGWIGGQAEYVMVPYADFNLLKFPDKEQAFKEKIMSLTLLSDIFPTGYHGAVTAGVQPGSTVYVAGAGPVGLACAAVHSYLARRVIVGDAIPERLNQAKSFGCEIVDITKGSVDEQIEKILGTPEVDAAVDCVGFEARGWTQPCKGSAGASFERLHDGDQSRRRGWYSRFVRHRRSGSNGRCRENRKLEYAIRSWVGKVVVFRDRSVPDVEV